ncbi:MAG: hypothetical protein Kow0075_11850 [Salibacteraceae bacterium]
MSEAKTNSFNLTQLTRVCAIAFFTCWTTLLAGQVENADYTIRIIRGEPYYRHTVLPGQSLEHIAKAYYTTTEALLEANPNAREGMNGGEVLLIPFTDESAEAAASLNSHKNQGAEISPPDSRPKTVWSNTAQPEPVPQAVRLVEESLQTQAQQPAMRADLKTPESDSAIVDPDASEMLESLKAIAGNLNSSLANLSTLRQLVQGEEGADPNQYHQHDAPPDSAANVLFWSFIDLTDSFSTDSSISLSEYFFVMINPRGEITNIKDERTITNNNTCFLDYSKFRGTYLNGAEGIKPYKIHPVAFYAEYRIDEHLIRSKSGRLFRCRGKKCKDEILPEDSLSELNALEELAEKGVYLVTIKRAVYKISLRKPFEYNPFALEGETLFEKQIESIEVNRVR